MTPLKRFTTGIAPFFVVSACAQIIGLSDYEKGDVSNVGGEGGQGTGDTSSGGSSGAGVKGGDGGAGDEGGSAGVLGTGGRISRGGTTSEGGAGGDPGGDAGQGGTDSGGTGAGKGGATAGGGGRGGTGGAGTGGGGGSGAVGGSPPCTEVTLPSYITRVLGTGATTYGFEIDPELGDRFFDLFSIQFYDDPGTYDGVATGVFMLGFGGDSNYASCSRCLLAYQDEGETAEKIFFQTSGTLTVAPFSLQMDGFPEYTFTDVTLREVTIGAGSRSTVTPGGACLHFASQSFSIEPPPDWTCELRWYADDDCDCGCDELDPMCDDSTPDSCDYCWCNDINGNCATGEVGATTNWTCN
jgi:hypothetical protein